MFIFFSSDIYNLYRKDIISSLSLPNGYGLHFRYPAKLITEDIKKDIFSLRNKEGVITYAKGNDFNKPNSSKHLEFLPIRMVFVKNLYFDNSTALYHFFFELGNFIQTNDMPAQHVPALDTTLPPYSFIYWQSKWSSKICKWYEKIEELIAFDTYFQNHLFFNINLKCSGIYSKLQAPIIFDKTDRSYYFQLKEDSNYIVEVSLFNSSIKHNSFEDYAIKIDYETQDLFITNPPKIIVGANADNRNYKLITKNINSIQTSSYIKFQSIHTEEKNENTKYDELIMLSIKKNTSKLVIFMIIAALGFWGTMAGAFATSEISKNNGNKHLEILLYAVSFLLFLGTGIGQFYYFNKRS